MGVLNNSGVYRRLHGCTYKYRGIQKYTSVFITIKVFTGLYTWVYTRIQQQFNNNDNLLVFPYIDGIT